ncbi:hypothetical protein HanPSC8_Chr06g0268431 [Helianthus annuus]|nr:hypothetical protein HanPSC8_Chr06g0268431 [Helianthus annuus]
MKFASYKKIIHDHKQSNTNPRTLSIILNHRLMKPFASTLFLQSHRPCSSSPMVASCFLCSCFLANIFVSLLSVSSPSSGSSSSSHSQTS